MNTIRCPLCLGQKIISSPGMMYKECPKCNGVGYIEIEDEKSKQAEPIQDKSCSQKEEVKVAVQKGSKRKSSRKEKGDSASDHKASSEADGAR